ncbi:MAG: VOC family protein [Acidobacteria bacterium]|nr:VOC family protein [Acidobacteriota bacterium]
MDDRLFIEAHPYADDVLALPVTDLEAAADYYARVLGLREVERRDDPPALLMERDGVRIGFSVNGGDASQEGAAILVSDLEQLEQEVVAAGAVPANSRIDERDGQRFKVFFLVAPDGLCYYLHQRLDDPSKA